MVFFIFIQILIEHSVANSGDPDQALHSAVSDLGLHCLPMSYGYIGWLSQVTLQVYPSSNLAINLTHHYHKIDAQDMLVVLSRCVSYMHFHLMIGKKNDAVPM